jgi:hypothetical protein
MHRNDDNELKKTRQREHSSFGDPQLRAALIAAVVIIAAGCSAEDIFKRGRVDEPCSAVYPTCNLGFAAGCYLDSGTYTEGQFPGDRRILVTTTFLGESIRVRLYFKEMIFPGTMILAQAYEVDCGDVERDIREDIDVFDEAGDDRIIIFDLPVETPGDHLIELYSDCAADYILTAEAFNGD